MSKLDQSTNCQWIYPSGDDSSLDKVKLIDGVKYEPVTNDAGYRSAKFITRKSCEFDATTLRSIKGDSNGDFKVFEQGGT